jgi:cell division GTPase FtsZ
MPTYRFREIGPREERLRQELGFTVVVEGGAGNNVVDCLIEDASNLNALRESMAVSDPSYAYVGEVTP